MAMEQQTSLRTNLQLGIYRVIDPFVKLLIKVGLTPNIVTSIGVFYLNVTAWQFIFYYWRRKRVTAAILPTWAGRGF